MQIYQYKVEQRDCKAEAVEKNRLYTVFIPRKKKSGRKNYRSVISVAT